MDKTELRLDPLSQEWTVFGEGRALPPVFKAVTGEQFDASPFRAGLERFASHSLYQDGGSFGWQVRVVPNRAPILRVEGDHAQNGEGFYEHMDGVGAHEIVIEDPGERRFEDLPMDDLGRVIGAWRARIEDLMRDGRLRAFTVVKNTGQAAGQSVGHSVSQVLALAIIPPTLRRKLDSARDYFAKKKRSLFADLLEEEQRRATRIVHENAGFVVFCPYASGAPFEMAVWPKRQSADFHHLNGEEITLLADALRSVLAKLNRALDHPAWNLTLTTAPSRTLLANEWTTLDEDFRWHISIVPRLHPTGGFEMATGCHVNGVWPEAAAEFLRSQGVQP